MQRQWPIGYPKQVGVLHRRSVQDEGLRYYLSRLQRRWLGLALLVLFVAFV